MVNELTRWNSHSQVLQPRIWEADEIVSRQGISLLCFIYDLFSFCQQSLPAALPLFFNSKNLLDKTRTYLRHPWYYPNTSLQSDWDVVLQITSTILLLPNRPHLVHVKAYQGNAATFDDLPAS
jgi:hypothetical protein